jgi:hypothetical protein
MLAPASGREPVSGPRFGKASQLSRHCAVFSDGQSIKRGRKSFFTTISSMSLRTRSARASPQSADQHTPSHAAKGGPSLRAFAKLFVIRRSRSGPRRVAVSALLLAAILAAGTVYVLHLRSEAEMSSFVQSHGVRATGTVLSVQNSGYQSRAWHNYSARIEVRLSDPVAGTLVTTASYPGNATVTDGDSVRVLVDPRNPQYAEVAGQPYYTISEWIFWAAAFGIVPSFLLLCAPISIIAIMRRRRGLLSI